MARRIIKLFPAHLHFIEPFAGGLSVLINKVRAPGFELAMDIDQRLIRFWCVLRDRLDDLMPILVSTPYCEASFEQALERLDSADDIEFAAAFMIRNRMSRGGLGEDFAWSERLRGGQPGDKNAWETALRMLPQIARRVANTQFVVGNAISTIDWRALGPDVLVYCDPPYAHETRTARDIYRHEMRARDHEALLDAITATDATVVLSGYHNDLYDRRLAGSRCVEFDMPNHSGQGKTKQRRLECVWVKPLSQGFRK